MESVTLENFRCFREKQTVRLAPLTLLVGENSTGKTSFLALIQALVEYAYERREPSFKREPFDLGSFDEIVHFSNETEESPAWFVAGMSAHITWRSRDNPKVLPSSVPATLDLKFAKPTRGTVPQLVRQRTSTEDSWVEELVPLDANSYRATLHTQRGEWTLSGSASGFGTFGLLLRINDVFSNLSPEIKLPDYPVEQVADSPPLDKADVERLRQLDFLREAEFSFGGAHEGVEAIAPVRTSPRRTYNPSSIDSDSEGDYLPSYLADLVLRQDMAWPELKEKLEDFGALAGLFEVVDVSRYGHEASSAFQLRVGFGGSEDSTKLRNLVDVGYGVSQALPIAVALLRPDGAKQFLLQQPEVHLHPSAQAALGSLFCNVASQGRQLIVETHSDHLMNRIRMDVRDNATALQPEDVVILFFERQDQDVRIHEITIDEQGNICGAPDSYREFFRLESRRSLGL